jgi:hypothetical protein
MEDNTIWTDGAFPDEKNYGLSKMEYAAIHIFASSVSSRPQMFEFHIGAQQREEIEDMADRAARKSWVLASKLANHSEYVANLLREGAEVEL